MSGEMRHALERAQAFRALARAFAPPDDRERLQIELGALGARARAPVASAVARALAALSAAPPDLADTHERLFGGRGGIPIRESAYADGRVVAPTELADLRGFLRAFGLEEVGALADHLASECELASALALKEAWARSQGWSERARIARDAYESLLGEHLLRWAPRVTAGVRRADAPPFYTAVAEALDAFLEEEARRLGLEVGQGGAAPPAPADEVGCGGCNAPCAETS